MRQTRKGRIRNERKAALREKLSGYGFKFAGHVVVQVATNVVVSLLKSYFFGS